MLSKKTSGNKSSSLLCGLSHLLISSIFTLRLIYFGVLVFECRYHYVACVHLLKPLKNFGTFVLEIKRSLSCVLWVHCMEAVKPPPRRGLTAPSGLRARSNRLSQRGSSFGGGEFYLVVSHVHSPLSDIKVLSQYYFRF
jgi:hypothetical protein